MKWFFLQLSCILSTTSSTLLNTDSCNVPSPSLFPSPRLATGNSSHTLHFPSYNKLPHATLLVYNTCNNGCKDDPYVFISSQNELLSLTPINTHSSISTYIGHTLHITTKNLNLNLTISNSVHAVHFLNQTFVLDPVDLPTKFTYPTYDTSVVPTSLGKAIKIRNLSSRTLHQYWLAPVSNARPEFQGVLRAYSTLSLNGYLTSSFVLLDNTAEVFRFQVIADQEIYAYFDETVDQVQLAAHLEEVSFAQYYKMEFSRAWLATYPHPLPVRTFMYPAHFIGQVLDLLHVVSVRPPIFVAYDLLSPLECEELIRLAKDRLARSSVSIGSTPYQEQRLTSTTRTSTNAWLARNSSSVVDDVYRKISALLRLEDGTFHSNAPDGVAEQMQVVHYAVNQYYVPHHDWVVKDNSTSTRFATVLLYLNDVQGGGGETRFPKAWVGAKHGLVVKPQRGMAVLFYNQFADGNVDEDTLHEARMVTKGEKWMANIWVHDKQFWKS